VADWVDGCCTATRDALVWCCSYVGSWFFTCIFEDKMKVRKFNDAFNFYEIFKKIQ
jgi:hypothetical protein